MHYVETYKEIKALQHTGFRGMVRQAALDLLALREGWRAEQLPATPRIQFIYVHHVFRDEEKQLEQLLARLQKSFQFISYNEAVDRLLNNNIDKPYLTLSSDDGFRNNLRAAEIMKQFDAKACFFINPALIGETDIQKIARHCDERLHLPPVEFLNWQEVDSILSMGHEIGSHTMQHINIANTSEEGIEEDMFRSYAALKEHCGEVAHFAYPYGRFFHFSEFGRKACFHAGFSSCATAERGCHINGQRPLQKEELCIRRDHVVLDWDINHILYFLGRGARRAKFENNFFPYSPL